MPDTLCRVAVHAVSPEDAATVELVLPAECPVGMLIPSIVDIVLDGPGTPADPHRWYLSHLGGGMLDTSKTLRDNLIRDGDQVVLAAVGLPAPQRMPRDPCGVVAETADRMAKQNAPGVEVVAGSAVTVLTAVALVWSAHETGTSSPLWTAAALSVTTATASCTSRVTRRMSAVLSLSAVVFAAVAGILAVPGAPYDVAALLASSAGLTVSLALVRVLGARSALIVAATTTGAVAAVTAVSAVVPISAAAAGASLTVLSVAALSTAPKLTVAAAGIGPSRIVIGARRSAAAHRVLTGLTAGLSVSAALGVVVAALDSCTVLTAVFAADVGLLLLLRSRIHVDAVRGAALGITGFAALATALIAAVRTTPGQAWWLCAAAVLACFATLQWPTSAFSSNPVVRHVLQVVEYLALAAVIPLAVWVSGLYGTLRELSLA